MFEYEIPLSDSRELLGLCEKPIIEKVRYEILRNNLVWEVDVFKGENEGLEIAEVELNGEHQKIDKPEWVGKDVLLEKKYFNSSLVNNPFVNWRSVENK